jgi:hypothetical protein
MTNVLTCLGGMVAGGLAGGFIASRNPSRGDYAGISDGPRSLAYISGMAVVGGLSALLVKDLRGRFLLKKMVSTPPTPKYKKASRYDGKPPKKL